MRASKSYHDVVDGLRNGVDIDTFDADENESMTDAIELETEHSGRRRLDSFYSATSKKSTYFSTGSTSSYHSIEDLEKLDEGIYLRWVNWKKNHTVKNIEIF